MVDIKDEVLTELRKNLDKLDEKLLKILEERFEIVKKVAKRKKEKGFPIRDLAREKEIIDSKCSKTPLPKETIQKVYQLLIDESARMQGEK